MVNGSRNTETAPPRAGNLASGRAPPLPLVSPGFPVLTRQLTHPHWCSSSSHRTLDGVRNHLHAAIPSARPPTAASASASCTHRQKTSTRFELATQIIIPTSRWTSTATLARYRSEVCAEGTQPHRFGCGSPPGRANCLLTSSNESWSRCAAFGHLFVSLPHPVLIRRRVRRPRSPCLDDSVLV